MRTIPVEFITNMEHKRRLSNYELAQLELDKQELEQIDRLKEEAEYADRSRFKACGSNRS